MKNLRQISFKLISIILFTGSLQAIAEQRPNILFILADDLGYGDLQCYNPDSKIPTPNLNKLAAQGMRFTDAHSPSTVCTPTRYSILTGRMQFRTGIKGVFTGAGGPCLIEKERLTLPQMLRAAMPSVGAQVHPPAPMLVLHLALPAHAAGAAEPVT